MIVDKENRIKNLLGESILGVYVTKVPASRLGVSKNKINYIILISRQ